MRLLLRAIALLALLLCPLLEAAVTERAEISFEGHSYQYTFIARLKGDVEDVRAIVTDFDNMKRINDDIVESRVLHRYENGDLKRLLKLRLWPRHSTPAKAR